MEDGIQNDDVIDFGDPDTPEPEQEVDDVIDAGDDPEPEQQSPQDDDPDEEWEAGGQKYKVKKSELRAGYMKDADYRQKTAKVA